MNLSAQFRQSLRFPVIVTALGVAVAVGAWIWNIASCCEGGANIGAGMLWMLGLALLVGGVVWGLSVVLAGRSDRRSASGEVPPDRS